MKAIDDSCEVVPVGSKSHPGALDPSGPGGQAPTLSLEVNDRSVVGGLRSTYFIRGDVSLADKEHALPKLVGGAAKYTLLEEIGRGGMGVVYKAVDNDIRRVVAMKVLLPNLKADRQLIEKFIEEAQATGQLGHPNIVPIYDIGTTAAGEVYYTMKYVKGSTLAQVIHDLDGEGANEGEWSLVRLLQVYQQLLMGVHFAHEKGVVHRDLKPANIMLGAFGEVLVMDWGLARILGDNAEVVTDRALLGGMRHESGIAGTPTYMSPEQVLGHIDAIDRKSDIYALGVILYEILTLRSPSEPSDFHALKARILVRDFPRPEMRNPDRFVPPALADLAFEAMAPEKSRRPATAKEMHDRVQHYIEGARDLERAHQKAVDLTEQGRLKMDGYFRLRERLGWHQMEVKETSQRFHGHESLEDKRELWHAERRVERTRHEMGAHFTRATELLLKSLGHDPDHRTAREYLADLYWSRFLEAEDLGQTETAQVFRALVEQYHDDKYAVELVGDGRLELDSDPPRAEVVLYEYREVNRLLVPQAARPLGQTPVNLSIRMGSFLVALSLPGFREVRYPVHIERMGRLTARVKLYREEDIGAGFVQVPEGKFIMGSNQGMADAVERCTPYLQDFFIARDPVTFAEYLDFLNDLAASDPEAAAGHVPRRNDGRPLWERRNDSLYAFPDRDEEGITHHPTLPVFGVSWHDANAYAAWRSRRDGLEFRLPYEVEWEKAARGVDGRTYPWGDRFDPTFCNMRQSLKDRPEPRSLESFPHDTSPYGMRHAAGNVRDWCLDAVDDGRQSWCVVRGGAWQSTEYPTRTTYRSRLLAIHTDNQIGFRLCRGTDRE